MPFYFLWLCASALAQTPGANGPLGAPGSTVQAGGTAPNRPAQGTTAGQPANTLSVGVTEFAALQPSVIARIKVQHPSSKELANNSWIGKRNDSVAYTDNIIQFRISNPQAFLNSKPGDQAAVVLYVDGVEMPGITSDWYSKVTTLQIQSKQQPKLGALDSINLRLVRNAASQASWNYFYSNTNCFTDSYIDLRNVSIGWEHMSPLGSGPQRNTLTIAFFYLPEFWIWTALLMVILYFFGRMAVKSDILRVNVNGPYSLSNTQLLFWTALVMSAFIYTLLLTDVSLSFNTSILYMLGISLGTTGVATAIDQNKISSQRYVFKGHDTFWRDLLTDGDSYSIQRMQTFAWNLILGLYFVTYTIKNKTMPEFSPTMLLLAGFSSTAYLAGKLPENTPAAQMAQTVQTALATVKAAADTVAAGATASASGVNAQAAADQAIKDKLAKDAQDALLQAAKNANDPSNKI